MDCAPTVRRQLMLFETHLPTQRVRMCCRLSLMLCLTASQYGIAKYLLQGNSAREAQYYVTNLPSLKNRNNSVLRLTCAFNTACRS